VIPDFISNDLVTALQRDARILLELNYFQPDGLTNTAVSKDGQGFTAKFNRQTFRGRAHWTSNVGDLNTRTKFGNLLKQLRDQLALELDRPSLKSEGLNYHEITYNWYESGAKLGRHLDEHHEETKGMKG